MTSPADYELQLNDDFNDLYFAHELLDLALESSADGGYDYVIIDREAAIRMRRTIDNTATDIAALLNLLNAPKTPKWKFWKK